MQDPLVPQGTIGSRPSKPCPLIKHAQKNAQWKLQSTHVLHIQKTMCTDGIEMRVWREIITVVSVGRMQQLTSKTHCLSNAHTQLFLHLKEGPRWLLYRLAFSDCRADQMAPEHPRHPMIRWHPRSKAHTSNPSPCLKNPNSSAETRLRKASHILLSSSYPAYVFLLPRSSRRKLAARSKLDGGHVQL